MKQSTTFWPVRRFMVMGYLTLFILVFGFGAWGAVARIAGAVIASGVLEVEGNRQVVQHPIGGVITSIAARDGDFVKAGELLIQLEGDALVSELGIVEGQWFELLARRSRLAAERDALETITFDRALVDQAITSPEISALMMAQIQQFEARRQIQAEEVSQLRERQAQIQNQIDGLEAVRAANLEQIALFTREIEGQETLFSQGLTQMTRVLTPKRDLAELEGNDGQVVAAIAENRAKIAEIEIERVRLVTELREAAISELRDIEFREIELRERRMALRDQIHRLDLRAPVTGIVYGSTADTLRGVIRPAEPVLYIVPQDSPLVVRARVDTIHIDKIHVDQEATLRFSSFDMRTTPDVKGRVIAVSADAYQDDTNGARFYRADVRLDDDAWDTVGTLKLIPGMPVETFITTDSRSPISYLVKPLSDYFTRAFRE